MGEKENVSSGPPRPGLRPICLNELGLGTRSIPSEGVGAGMGIESAAAGVLSLRCCACPNDLGSTTVGEGTFEGAGVGAVAVRVG